MKVSSNENFAYKIFATSLGLHEFPSSSPKRTKSEKTIPTKDMMNAENVSFEDIEMGTFSLVLQKSILSRRESRIYLKFKPRSRIRSSLYN